MTRLSTHLLSSSPFVTMALFLFPRIHYAYTELREFVHAKPPIRKFSQKISWIAPYNHSSPGITY